jgi:hypothetical protein
MIKEMVRDYPIQECAAVAEKNHCQGRQRLPEVHVRQVRRAANDEHAEQVLHDRPVRARTMRFLLSWWRPRMWPISCKAVAIGPRVRRKAKGSEPCGVPRHSTENLASSARGEP